MPSNDELTTGRSRLPQSLKYMNLFSEFEVNPLVEGVISSVKEWMVLLKEPYFSEGLIDVTGFRSALSKAIGIYIADRNYENMKPMYVHRQKIKKLHAKTVSFIEELCEYTKNGQMVLGEQHIYVKDRKDVLDIGFTINKHIDKSIKSGYKSTSINHIDEIIEKLEYIMLACDDMGNVLVERNTRDSLYKLCRCLSVLRSKITGNKFKIDWSSKPSSNSAEKSLGDQIFISKDALFVQVCCRSISQDLTFKAIRKRLRMAVKSLD